MMSIEASELPDRLGTIKGKTLSRKTSEVPVKSRKVNAYNYKKGRPMTKIEKMFRKMGGKMKEYADGGILPTENQGVTFRPSDVQQNLPGITETQLADLIMQASQGNQGVVSDTIQFQTPDMIDANQREVPVQFTTPSSNFSITGYNLNAPAAGKQVAPILPQRAYGGKMKKKGCGGKMKNKCGGKMTKFSK